MMPAKPTTHPRPHEATHNPYLPSNSLASGPQPFPSFISLGNQAQSGQPHIITSPGIFANSQQGQGNVQIITPTIGTATTTFTEEAKILGAIQIVVGLTHIGFGIILGLMNVIYASVLGFASVTFISGYPFWGGLSFIITGALSISASMKFSLCMIKGSLGMNIVSAIFSFLGMILFLVDVSINGQPNQDYWAIISGKGISAMLIIFSLAEFCITCTTAHFASQLVSNTTGSVLVHANSPLTQETPFSSSSLAPPRNDGHPPYTVKY
ncbi:membrane-spanning 4-domains subfamily A member 12 isoform X1 [Rhinolophus sinicus]|uniref:membrane-spanning 4-domains subfamily A member 12 isoform X1 n=1 Tax=Rhinolophus sinicus TaxID=89399 RepID=UPI003D79C2D5